MADDPNQWDPSQQSPPGLFISPGDLDFWTPDFSDGGQPAALAVIVSDPTAFDPSSLPTPGPFMAAGPANGLWQPDWYNGGQPAPLASPGAQDPTAFDPTFLPTPGPFFSTGPDNDMWQPDWYDGGQPAALVAPVQDLSTQDMAFPASPPGLFISPGNLGFWQPDFGPPPVGLPGPQLDPSSPPSAILSGPTSTVTCNSFTPPVGSVIEAVLVLDGGPANVAQQVLNVSNTGAVLSWRLLQRSNNYRGDGTLGGAVETWWAYNANYQAAMTVTANFATAASGGMMQVLVFTGAAPDQSLAAATPAWQGSPGALPSATVTTTAANSRVWGAVLNYVQQEGPVAPAGQQLYGAQPVWSVGFGWIQYVAATVAAAGTAVTVNDTAPSCYFNMLAWEVLAGNPITVATPAMPASGVSVTNTFMVNAAVFISGGTVFDTQLDGQSLASLTRAVPGLVIVPPGHTITLIYTAAPQWVWTLF